MLNSCKQDTRLYSDASNSETRSEIIKNHFRKNHDFNEQNVYGE